MFRDVGTKGGGGVCAFRGVGFRVRRLAKGGEDVFKNVDVVHSQEDCHTGQHYPVGFPMILGLSHTKTQI